MQQENHGTPCGKTCQGPSPQTEAKTSNQSSRPLRVLRSEYQFLDLRNGGLRAQSWETIGQSHGEPLTLSTGESPKEENVSILSQILMEEVPEKYSLSLRACRGILERAKRRGKTLPKTLEEALVRKCSTASDGMDTNHSETQPEPSQRNTEQGVVMPQSSYPKVFENNLTDARLKDTGDISPTVLARYGTGGNTQPIVLETFTQQRFDYYIANNVGKTLGVKTGGIGGGSETLIVDAYPESSFGTYSESGVCGSLRRTGGETGGGGETIVISQRQERD